MRILLTADPELPVPPTFYGGIERIVDQLAAELRARGHTVGLVARAGSTCAVDAFYPWPAGRSDGFGAMLCNSRALARAVRTFRPEVVHSFSRLAFLAGVLRGRVPLVMSFQRAPTPRTVRWAARLARRLWFTGCSEHIAAAGRAAGGAWTAIPNFVDPGRYRFRATVPANAHLVFLSRIEAIKGAHVAIAVARAAGRPLVLAGNRGETGEAARYWDREIAPQVDGVRVRHVGPVDDAAKDAWLGGAAALLVPVQWDEPFGIVFAEALACGTPVVSCPRGALPEIIRDGVEGWLARDEAGLIAAVHRIGVIDRAACRRRVEENFAVGPVTTRYLQLYAEACAAS